MCFEKMLTTLVSTLEDRSNSADAIASINSRLALNSANKSPVEPLRRSAKSLSAAMLIWHCTIFCPFLIVNLNVIKAASYPTALPRVSGMHQLPFDGPLKRTARWVRQLSVWCCSYCNGPRRAMRFSSMTPRSISDAMARREPLSQALSQPARIASACVHIAPEPTHSASR